jgi:hypothetical protein
LGRAITLGMREELKKEAIKLRLQGFSYTEIQEKIHISKYSLIKWLRHIPLTEKQRKRLINKSKAGRIYGSNLLKEERIRRTKEIVGRAIKEVKPLNKNALWLTGTILYWAEGHKQKEHRPSQRVCFSNSDPEMLKIFLKWLKECLCVEVEDVVFEIYIHETYKKTREELSSYWSEITGFSIDKLRTVYYKKNKVHSYRKNRGVGYNGVLRISVKRSTDLNRQITGWIYGVCEKLSISDIIPE